MSTLEISANAFNILSVFLAARNNAWTWGIGIIGCILYGVLFFEVKLYADVTLQAFFIVTSLYGWFHWLKGGPGKEELPISRVRLSRFFLYLLAGIVSAAVYGTLLARTTDAALPLIDSFVLCFSVTAQFLLMQRKLESWIFWLLVNTVAVPLFYSKGLILTSVVYGIFWVNAFYGFWVWKKKA